MRVLDPNWLTEFDSQAPLGPLHDLPAGLQPRSHRRSALQPRRRSTRAHTLLHACMLSMASRATRTIFEPHPSLPCNTRLAILEQSFTKEFGVLRSNILDLWGDMHRGRSSAPLIVTRAGSGMLEVVSSLPSSATGEGGEEM